MAALDKVRRAKNQVLARLKPKDPTIASINTAFSKSPALKAKMSCMVTRCQAATKKELLSRHAFAATQSKKALAPVAFTRKALTERDYQRQAKRLNGARRNSPDVSY
jgi:hypothetical protein